MKRSSVNNAILESIDILDNAELRLPPFAYWNPDDWAAHKDQLGNMVKIGLGWDVTDFGTEDFAHCGGVLFTIRNGCINHPTIGTPYAEKFIILRHATEQVLPMHFHRMKTEDIINRSGGTLMMKLYGSMSDGQLDEVNSITLMTDGIPRTFRPGEVFEIGKGESITLTPGIYHSFWAKKDAGDVVAGEISSINDDTIDNVFLGEINRFSCIDEDAAPLFFLCNEYHAKM